MVRTFPLIRRFSRPLCLLLALYTLNFCVDTPDALPDRVAEDLSFNDIESFYEFVLEGVAGMDNAVQEHEERDDDTGGIQHLKKWYLACAEPLSNKNTGTPFNSYAPPHVALHVNAVAIEVAGPPPRG
jgi:hypothetical protein